jgi:3-methyladenine DNA glycosylase AlkC
VGKREANYGKLDDSILVKQSKQKVLNQTKKKKQRFAYKVMT